MTWRRLNGRSREGAESWSGLGDRAYYATVVLVLALVLQAAGPV